MAPGEDPHTIARRANAILPSTVAGFRHCAVESVSPPVLAYEFDSNIDAENYKFQAEVQSPGIRMEISPDDPTTLLHFL